MGTMTIERVRRPRRFTAHPGDRISLGGVVYVVSANRSGDLPFVRTNECPLCTQYGRKPNAETIEAIEETRDPVRSTRLKAYSTPSEFFADLGI